MSERGERQLRILRNLFPGFSWADILLVIVFFGYVVTGTARIESERGTRVLPYRAGVSEAIMLVMLFAVESVYGANVALIFGITKRPEAQKRSKAFRNLVCVAMILCPVIHGAFFRGANFVLVPAVFFFLANAIAGIWMLFWRNRSLGRLERS